MINQLWWKFTNLKRKRLKWMITSISMSLIKKNKRNRNRRLKIISTTAFVRMNHYISMGRTSWILQCLMSTCKGIKIIKTISTTLMRKLSSGVSSKSSNRQTIITINTKRCKWKIGCKLYLSTEKKVQTRSWTSKSSTKVIHRRNLTIWIRCMK